AVTRGNIGSRLSPPPLPLQVLPPNLATPPEPVNAHFPAEPSLPGQTKGKSNVRDVFCSLIVKIANQTTRTRGRSSLWPENARATTNPRPQGGAGSQMSWQPPDSYTPSKSAGAARALSTAATKHLSGEASPSR